MTPALTVADNSALRSDETAVEHAHRFTDHRRHHAACASRRRAAGTPMLHAPHSAAVSRVSMRGARRGTRCLDLAQRCARPPRPLRRREQRRTSRSARALACDAGGDSSSAACSASPASCAASTRSAAVRRRSARDDDRRFDLRQRRELERRLGDHAERAQRSDVQLVHVVAGDVLHHAPARLADRAVRMHDAHADQPVARRAVRVPQRPVRVRGQHAADRRALVRMADQAEGTARARAAAAGDRPTARPARPSPSDPPARAR